MYDAHEAIVRLTAEADAIGLRTTDLEPAVESLLASFKADVNKSVESQIDFIIGCVGPAGEVAIQTLISGLQAAAEVKTPTSHDAEER